MARHSKHLKKEAEALRLKGGLDFLQLADPSIQNVIMRATFVSVYVLNEIDQKWARADLEGPLYVVYRSVAPHFRLVIVNQRDPKNLVEDITPLWEVSSEKNYLFFRVPLNSKVDTHPVDPKDRRVAGLWFSDDFERQSVQNTIERLLSSGLSTTVFEHQNLEERSMQKLENLRSNDAQTKKNLKKSPGKSPSVRSKGNTSRTRKSTLKCPTADPEGKIAGEAILNLIGVHRSTQPSSTAFPSNGLEVTSTQCVENLTKTTDNSVSPLLQGVTASGAVNDDPAFHSKCSSLRCLPPRHDEFPVPFNNEASLDEPLNQVQDSTVCQNVSVQLQLYAQQHPVSLHCVADSNVTEIHPSLPTSLSVLKSAHKKYSKTPMLGLSQILPQQSPVERDRRSYCSTLNSLVLPPNNCVAGFPSTHEGCHCRCSCVCGCVRQHPLCYCSCIKSVSAPSNVPPKSPCEGVPNPLSETTCCDAVLKDQPSSSCSELAESFLTELDQRLLVTLLSRLLKPPASCFASRRMLQPCERCSNVDTHFFQCSPKKPSSCIRGPSEYHPVPPKPTLQNEYPTHARIAHINTARHTVKNGVTSKSSSSTSRVSASYL